MLVDVPVLGTEATFTLKVGLVTEAGQPVASNKLTTEYVVLVPGVKVIGPEPFVWNPKASNWYETLDVPSFKIKSKGATPTRFHDKVTKSPWQIDVGPLRVADILLIFGNTVTVSIAIHPGLRESVAITWKSVWTATVATGFWIFADGLRPTTPPLVRFVQLYV